MGRNGVLSSLIELIASGVIATAGSNGEFAMLGRVGFDVDYAISAKACGAGGMIADGVLIANILGNFRCNLVDFTQRAREIGDAPGLIRKGLQGLPGLLVLSCIGVIQQADSVDDRSAEILYALDSLLLTQS